MDVNNSKPTQGSPNMATNSWRSQLTAEPRQKIVRNIINMCVRQSPSSDPSQIKNIVLRFEEKIFTAARRQEDYLRHIYRKLRLIEDGALLRLPSVPPNAAENPGDQDSLCEEQQLIMQRRQLFQSKNTFPAQSANLKFERGQVDEDTWREEIYQWIQTLKKLFFLELREMDYKLDGCLRQSASAPQPQMSAVIEERCKTLQDVKKFTLLLQTARHEIVPQHKQHIARVEKELISFFIFRELIRPRSSQHHKQHLLPNMNAFQQSTHAHNQESHQSDTNMLQSVQLKQQGITKSHLGEKQHPQGKVVKQKRQRKMKNMQQPLDKVVKQKRQRKMKNKQQPLEFHAQQMSGSHMNLTEVLIVKQEMGNAGTPMQHHFSREQQVKLEPPSPVSYPQVLQVPSTHPCQNPSQKKQNLQTSPEKTGTSAGIQQASGAGMATSSSLQITTLGLSVSPLLESSNNKDNNPGNVSECNPHEPSVIEQPLQRLLRVVNSMSPAALGESVEALKSVVGIVERISESVPEKASKPVVGADLVAMTQYHLQEICSPTAFLISGGADSWISEMESMATFPERTTIKANNSLMEEIRMINRRLINTVVEISDNNDNSCTVASFTEDSQAKIVKCSFIAPATTQNFISSHASENLLAIQPLKLLIPGTYPSHSPLVLDKPSALAIYGDASMSNEDLWVKAVSTLELHLQSAEQPISLQEIAKTWDACASSVVCEFAEKYGGGTFSSRYGVWENSEVQW